MCKIERKARKVRDMSNFMNQLAGTAWAFIPVLLILFLLAGILFVFYYKNKVEEQTRYLRSIAQSLEKIAGSKNDPYTQL